MLSLPRKASRADHLLLHTQFPLLLSKAIVTLLYGVNAAEPPLASLCFLLLINAAFYLWDAKTVSAALDKKVKGARCWATSCFLLGGLNQRG